MQVLGISVAHDSSACLLKDGEIVQFFKEERLSRKKRDKLPFLSLIKLLENNTEKIDVVAFSPVDGGEEDFLHNVLTIMKKYGHTPEIFNLENNHHLQHAALAFYSSNFDDASVIVIDRNGSDFGGARECETIFSASKNAGFVEIYKNFWVYHNSAQELIQNWGLERGIDVDASSLFGIVKVYEAATTMIGQDALENGKTMGLSAYGKLKDSFPNLFANNTNIPQDHLFSHTSSLGENYQTIYKNLSHYKPENFSKQNFQEYADFAAQVQLQTQNAVSYLVKKALAKNKTKNIVITGGYGLNVVANNFLIKSFPEANFYFEPIADDSGTSIGGAMFAYSQIAGYNSVASPQNLFFHGQKHSLSNIQGQNFSTEKIVDLVLQNKTIGIYNGLAEAGPRALGNRSIIFNASNSEAKKIVNEIKKREWYRPFAAAVLESDANSYFDMVGLSESKNMTVSFDAFEKTKQLFPGIIHVDGSCRIQTVGEGDGVFFEILSLLKEKTGHGILLNTSFNLAGDPLVETPEDAFSVFQNSKLDVLWFAEVSKGFVK